MTTETALSPRGSGAPAEVTVVVSTGCHFCADAEDALAGMAGEFPIHVNRVAALSPQGMDLMQEHRASMSPLVLLDDSFVSWRAHHCAIQSCCQQCAHPAARQPPRAVSPALIAVLLAALLLPGCSGAPSGTAPPALTEQTAKSGPVDIAVTPTQVGATGASFDVSLDNNILDLSADPVTAATLTVDGVSWVNPSWQSGAQTGHHMSGTLRFDPVVGAPEPHAVQLQLNPTPGGISEAVTMSWTLP